MFSSNRLSRCMEKIQTQLRNAGITALAVLALSGAALGDDVKKDYDHNADFSRVRTYSWGQVKTADPLYVDRIKDEVNKDLQAAGLRQVPSGGDTTVFATGTVKNQQELQTMYDNLGPGFGRGWGRGWGWGGWGWGMGGGFGESTTTTVERPEAELVLDMFTSADRKLLWRGIVQRDVSNKTEKNIKNLDKDIDKLLKDFPPKTKS